MPRHDIVTQLIDQIKDIERQLRALQRLDVTPPPASIVTYTGTPTSGQLAQWNGGGTLTHSGYAGSAVARYSGAPVAGNYSYWTAAGTIADSGFGTSQLPRYSGTPTAGRYPVWTAAGTIADSGFGTADLPRYTGTPSAGKYTYWTGAGTIAASTFGTADLPRYSGTPSAGNFAYWTGAGTVAGSGIGTASVALLAGTQTFSGVNTFSQNVIGSVFKAAGTAGVQIQDDGGNAGVAVADGGATTVGVDTATFTPVTSGVGQTTFGNNALIASLAPGSITTSQTWTIDITVTTANNNRGGVLSVLLYDLGSAVSPSSLRLLYKADIAWYRTTVGSTATITAVNESIKDAVGVTLTGPTAIADGIRFTVHPTAGTLNRVAGMITGVEPGATISSAVA